MPASAFMTAALEAALRVRGTTGSNPWVGAAVVRDGEMVAVGATEPPGGRHAEAVALDIAGERAAGADLYVTLEPCSPFPGKRTPPCSDRVIEAGIRRLVVALEDPDIRVSGRGLDVLRAAGVTIDIGDGADEARRLLRPYIKHRRTGLPYVIAKFAASLDGRTATASGDSKWITGELARDYAHQQRAWVDAILVGSGTVLADDPALTARPGDVMAARQPHRVVVDARGRTPPGARLFREPGQVIVATTMEADPSWRSVITATGAQVVQCEPAQPGVNLDQLMRVLGARGILSVWAEGGATLLGSLFDAGLVDEVWAFIAPVVLGGGDAIPAVAGPGAANVATAWRLVEPHVERLGDDVLVRGYVNPEP